MKDMFSFFEKVLSHNLFVFIVGIILLILSASSGINVGSFKLPLDIFGRITLLVIGLGTIIAFAIYNLKKQPINFTFKHKIEPIFTEKPVFITAKSKNKSTISSEFIFWDKCSILIWINIPKQNQGIRNSPTNRYILAHHNGEVKNNNKHSSYLNQFTLRHDTSNNWNISVSDSHAKYMEKKVSLPDSLDEGWHHFFITWDKTKSDLIFQIRNVKGELKESQSFTDRFDNWTEYTNKKNRATVGAFHDTDYEGHYCETELFNLTLVNAFLTEKDTQFKEHLSRKPMNI